MGRALAICESCCKRHGAGLRPAYKRWRNSGGTASPQNMHRRIRPNLTAAPCPPRPTEANRICVPSRLLLSRARAISRRSGASDAAPADKSSKALKTAGGPGQNEVKGMAEGDVAGRVRKIVVENLGVVEDKVVDSASFIDD